MTKLAHILWFVSSIFAVQTTAAETLQTDSTLVGGAKDSVALVAGDSVPSIQLHSSQPSRSTFWKRIGIGAEVGASSLLELDEECKAIMHNHESFLYDLHVDFRTSPDDNNPYDAAYAYPTLRAGILLADYRRIRLWRSEPRLDYVSGMGMVTALYGGFLRDLYRSRRFRTGYKLVNGLGIASRPYRRSSNADNEIIGSRWNIFIDLGLYAKFLFSPHLEASLGVDFCHFSNSALDRPNKGANNAGLTLGLTWYPEDYSNLSPVRRSAERFADKRFYVETSVGWVGKTLLDDWVIHYWNDGSESPDYRTSHFTIHHAVTALVAPMWRYCRRYASGFGLDYTYAAYASRLAKLDDMRGQTNFAHSRHVVGLTARHEVFFRHLSLAMGLGVYLHRKMGYTAHEVEKPYYETVGLRYNFPFTNDRLFIGYNVKAHLTKADCMQVSVGWRLGKK